MTSAFASLLLAVASPAAPPGGGSAQLPCDPATALRMTTMEIAAAGKTFEGHCVRVSGIGGYDTLFDSVEGVYRWARAGRPDRSPHTLRFHQPRIGEPSSTARAAHLEVTGRLWSCSLRFAPDASRRFPGVQGCASNPHVLIADRIEWAWDRSQSLERLVGDAMKARFGSLVEAPTSWSRLPAARAAAAAFLHAIRSGDWARLATLHGEEHDRPSGHLSRLFTYFVDNPDSPFQQLRETREVQTAIFVDGPSPAAPVSANQGRATICFCRTADCTGLWPIRLGDETGSDRPYACTLWEVQVPNPDPQASGIFMTDSSESWLVEPAASAFRRQSESFRR